MNAVRALFFDMDDTLLDSQQATAMAWEIVGAELAPELGVEPQRLRDAFRREAMAFWHDEAAVGHWRVRLHEAREQILRRALESEGADPDRAPLVNDRYIAEHRAQLKLFDDAIETLESAARCGYRLALITNGPAGMQRDKIARFELAQYFDVIVVEGEFGKGKPEREVFEYALKSTAVDPVAAWHVGDNLYADIGGAQAAGIHAVWIHRERLQLPENGGVRPDRAIGHLVELREALGL
ncbi:MAG: HAD family hydrolase [Dehalococcoidia bacterium]